MSRVNYCPNCACETRPKRRSWLGMIVQVLFVWAALVFSGGTLINTGHPVAVETGRLIQTVTLAEPAARWSEDHGMKPVASAIEFLRHGVDLAALT